MLASPDPGRPDSPLYEAWRAWQSDEKGMRSPSAATWVAYLGILRRNVVAPQVRRDMAESDGRSCRAFACCDVVSEGKLERLVTETLAGQLVLDQVVEKWLAMPRQSTLEQYVGLALERLLHQARLGDQPASGGKERYHTASSNILAILGKPQYRTVAEAPEPWKAPAEWPDPVACHHGSLEVLATQAGQFIAAQGPVTMKGCQALVDDVYECTGDAHNRPQFLDVMVLQGLFQLQGWSLSEVNEKGHPKRDLPDERKAKVEVDLRILLLAHLRRLPSKHQELLAEFLRLYVPDEVGRLPDFSPIHVQMAKIRDVGRSAINMRFKSHIWPWIQSFQLRMALTEDVVHAALLTLNPDDLCPWKEIA